ncbi:hypothetical protein AALO_G00167950 [Alosa alosa]|uniref:Glutaredoxin-like protein n=2 Tax=Alosa alosa TaxID=278164 RepID=A0AAV6GC02_9TELE|nr:hypothetical protein AALO_G00167950 [Alosa alosa]
MSIQLSNPAPIPRTAELRAGDDWDNKRRPGASHCQWKLFLSSIREMHWFRSLLPKRSVQLLIRRSYSSPLQLPTLTLFTKDPCPLCDDAKEVLEPYKHRFTLQQVDITLPENKVWYDRYKFDIPVFHLNGQFLMMHRVNTTLLEKRLAKLEESN